MSRRKAPARTRRVTPDPLRQIQRAIALAGCIHIAADHSEAEQVDIADAISVLLLVLKTAAAALDQQAVAP